jgi:hypothetical protein
VNGVEWDLLRPLEGDCKLELMEFDTKEGGHTFWHSSAHVLGSFPCTRTCDTDVCVNMRV